MPRSESLKKLTSAMTRVENAFNVVSDLPAADRARVLSWAQDEVIGPMRDDLNVNATGGLEIKKPGVGGKATSE
jgi:hypothetical protein